MRELTTSQLAQKIGCEPYLLRKWNYRGFLKKAPQGASGQGRGKESIWSHEAQIEAIEFASKRPREDWRLR